MTPAAYLAAAGALVAVETAGAAELAAGLPAFDAA